MTDAASYMKKYRRDNPEYVKEQRLQNRARDRALRLLAANHLDEFNSLYNWKLRELRDAATNNHAANPVSQRRTKSDGSDTGGET